MEEAKTHLIEWTIEYLKHRDIVAKKIVEIKKGCDGCDILVESKDRKQYFYIMPSCENFNGVFDIREKNSQIGIVTLNNKKNLNSIIRNWEHLCEYKLLSVMFVNPFANADKRWTIFPYTHNNICDHESFERGLMALMEGVETIEEEEEEEFSKRSK